MRTFPSTVVFLGLACLVNGYYRLTHLSYLKLPTALSSGSPVYQGLNRDAAIEAAYDYHNYIVYVIGKANRLLHVIDIHNPNTPKLLLTHEFTPTDGTPTSVAVCGNEVAVGLAAQTSINEGHIRIYHTYTKGSDATDLTLDGYLTVGPSPDHIQYTSTCGTLVIPNEGKPGKDEGARYVDPEGTVAIMETEKTGNPSLRHVDFQDYNHGQPSYDVNIREPSLFVPASVHPTTTSFAQDVEPTYAAISSNLRTVWVTLPANNAIAQIDIDTGLVSAINPLPLKDWSQSPLDGSDRDGGVHRRLYPGLKSLRQPTVIKTMDIGSKTFLFTADTGSVRTYTRSQHTFTWTDSVLAKSLVNNIDNDPLKAEASNDEHLGRLQVSQVDGKDPRGMYSELVAFGGRGFSIWDSKNFAAPVFDSKGSLEEYMEATYKDVFNTDYSSSTAAYQSPEVLRDAVSDNMKKNLSDKQFGSQGAMVTGMDLEIDNGTTFLVVGTSSTGTLYLYVVDDSTGQPVPSYQSIYRSGIRDQPWNDLYTNKTAGDLYITDIGIITSDHSPLDKPLVYVISKGSGAMSIYEIDYVTTTVGG